MRRPCKAASLTANLLQRRFYALAVICCPETHRLIDRDFVAFWIQCMFPLLAVPGWIWSHYAYSVSLLSSLLNSFISTKLFNCIFRFSPVSASIILFRWSPRNTAKRTPFKNNMAYTRKKGECEARRLRRGTGSVDLLPTDSQCENDQQAFEMDLHVLFFPYSIYLFCVWLHKRSQEC